MAAAAGAWAVGLVGPTPSGLGVFDLAEIAALIPEIPAGVRPVLLTSPVKAAGIADEVRRTGVPRMWR